MSKRQSFPLSRGGLRVSPAAPVNTHEKTYADRGDRACPLTPSLQSSKSTLSQPSKE